MLNIIAQSNGLEYGTYDSTYSSTSAQSDPASGLVTLGVFMFVLAIFAIIWLISAILLWKVFTKAGQPGWKALIPIYNNWVLFEISGKPGYWSLAFLIPFVGSILATAATIVAMLQLAKNFGKNTTFAVIWLILLPFIGLIMLGFGDAKYLGPDATGTESGGMPSLGAPQPNLAQNTPSANSIPNHNGQPTTQPSAQPSTNTISPQSSANGFQPPTPPNQNPPTV